MEHHGLLVGVDLGGMPLDLPLHDGPFICMHLSHELGLVIGVYVDTLALVEEVEVCLVVTKG